MKKKKVIMGNYKAYDPIKKQWFTWSNWDRKDLKQRCDQEGLIKFQKI
jgi:inhibitor of KinA sporulation pathway (predicted exonuclease)